MTAAGPVDARTVAGLPMYDWPEVAAHVDELWAAIRDELRARDVEAPDELSRPEHLEKLWRNPALVVGQVCSLNPVRDGLGEVEPLGTIVYEPPAGLPDPEPGIYYSVLVCRDGVAAPGADLRHFRDATIAANGTDSQSGYWSLGHHVRALVADRPLFGSVRFTGSHRESVRDLAAGRSDLAAIDVHSWRLALEHEPAAAGLTVIGTTEPTPGVVCVTAWERLRDRDVLAAAVAAGVDRIVGTPTAEALHITGFRPRTMPEFHVVADRVVHASRHPWHT